MFHIFFFNEGFPKVNSVDNGREKAYQIVVVNTMPSENIKHVAQLAGEIRCNAMSLIFSCCRRS